MTGSNQAKANEAIDPHYSLEQFTLLDVINPLPVEKFLSWLDGSIFWRYLVLLKIYVISLGIYIRFNLLFLLIRYFPWPSFISRIAVERLFFTPTVAFYLVLVGSPLIEMQLERLAVLTISVLRTLVFECCLGSTG